MSLLARALTVSHLVLNVAVTFSFGFMSYYWYQNARSIQDSRNEYNNLYYPRCNAVSFMTNTERCNLPEDEDENSHSQPDTESSV